jgi:hypothetical protein
MTTNPSIFVRVLQHVHDLGQVVGMVLAIVKIIFNFSWALGRAPEGGSTTRSEWNAHGKYARSWFCRPAGWRIMFWGRRIRRHGFGTLST